MSQEPHQLVELLDRTIPGRLSLALVEGMPDGGDARLLEQFVATARRHGATTAHPQDWTDATGMARLAATGTLVLTCEYPQWIDARVWPLLDALARTVPVLVVLTHRTGTDRPGPGRHPDTERPPLAGAYRIMLDPDPADAVAAKLAALSAPARHLLQVASTIGPSFGLLELARLMGCGTAALLPAVDEAMASGLVVGAGEFLMFSHELVREHVEASLCRPAVVALRAERAGLAPAPAQRRTPETGWAALTEQELEIARLVGRALTNQQIATRIGRSRHTVNYHLRQIFRKLGIGSRVELASLAQSRARAADHR